MSNPLPILAGEKRLLSASSTSTALLPRSCLFAFKAGGKSSEWFAVALPDLNQ